MAGKKTFKDSMGNPAELFISAAQQDTQPEITAEPEISKAPEGYKINPLYIETKSKRINLLLQPSLHDKLKRKAKREHTSVNDLIHTILQEATREE